MQGDATLQALLGDPVDDPQKIFYLNPPEKLPLPYIIFWTGTGEMDGSLERVYYNQVIGLNIAAWVSQNRASGDAEHEAIIDRVVFLFHKRNYEAALDGSAYFSLLNQVQPDLYDEHGNAWGRVAQFTVHLRRTII